MEAELEKELEEHKAGLSETELEELVRRTKILEEYQSAPESKEDLEKIPVPSISPFG